MNRFIFVLLALAGLALFGGSFQIERSAPPNEDLRLIRLNDTLYYDTKEVSKIKGRCGVMDGQIYPSVLAGEIPDENFTSNLEETYGYQWISDEKVDVYIDGMFWVFKKWDEKT